MPANTSLNLNFLTGYCYDLFPIYISFMERFHCGFNKGLSQLLGSNCQVYNQLLFNRTAYRNLLPFIERK